MAGRLAEWPMFLWEEPDNPLSNISDGGNGTVCDGHSIPPFKNLEVWQGIAMFPGVCAMIISFVHIGLHIKFNKADRIRPCVIRMLFTIPFYTVDALWCLQTESHGPRTYAIATARDFYECVMLVSFVQFLLAVMSAGQTRGSMAYGLSKRMLTYEENPDFHGIMAIWKWIPVPLFETVNGKRKWYKMSVDQIILLKYHFWPDFICGTLIGIMQYVWAMASYFVIRMVVAYNGGPEAGDYCRLAEKFALQLKAASCGIAMFHLLLLAFNLQYNKGTRDEVHKMGLEAKFFSVKGIVFFVLAQTWVIRLGLVSLPELYQLRSDQSCDEIKLSQVEIRQTWEDFLLCFEAFFFAVCHLKAYSADEFNLIAAKSALKKAMSMLGAVKEGDERGHVNAVKALDAAISEGQKVLEQRFKCKMGQEDLTKNLEGDIVLINISDDPALVKEASSVIVKDPVLVEAEKELAKSRGPQRSKSDEQAQKKADKKKMCYRWFTNTFGFLGIYYDIQACLNYARSCRAALEILQRDTQPSNAELEQVFKSLDFDDDGQIQFWEVRIIFKRLPNPEQDIPGWLVRLFREDDGNGTEENRDDKYVDIKRFTKAAEDSWRATDTDGMKPDSWRGPPGRPLTQPLLS